MTEEKERAPPGSPSRARSGRHNSKRKRRTDLKIGHYNGQNQEGGVPPDCEG